MHLLHKVPHQQCLGCFSSVSSQHAHTHLASNCDSLPAASVSSSCHHAALGATPSLASAQAVRVRWEGLSCGSLRGNKARNLLVQQIAGAGCTAISKGQHSP